MKDFSKLNACLEEALKGEVFPGAVVLIGQEGLEVFKESYGSHRRDAKKDENPLQMSLDTVFDIGSLTNVVVTTTLLMKLCEEGQVHLEDKVARYLQGFSVHGKATVSVGHLLNHTSGLAAKAAFYEELVKANSGSKIGILSGRGAKEFVLNEINRSKLKYEPGTKQLYSDMGFIVLGYLIETLTGLNLEIAAQRYIFQPLGLKNTAYIDLSKVRRKRIEPVPDLIAPTEECPWRKKLLCGEVYDENAWAMGGVAGHSGVFSTASDLHRFVREMLASYRGESRYLSAETVDMFWRGPDDAKHNWRYGWNHPSGESSFQEVSYPSNLIGISSFTGCSLWVEPHQGLDIIFLSNRIHPSKSNKKIYSFWGKFYKEVFDVF